jgi:MinD-like ATPase involved in chromosome partitioning or flagellar assembly
MQERYVLLGLARPRADWFRRVGQWSTSAVVPAEFVRCVSAEELRARLGSGRPFSALLVDADLPALDRDLVAVARAADCAVLVVDALGARDWRGLGAAGVLQPDFTREDLLEALAAHAEMVGAASLADEGGEAVEATTPTGRLIAVTGPGGTGASSAAIGLAQGLAAGHGELPGRRRAGTDQPPPPPTVLLADLCRVADQAVLHDSRVLVPGIQEVVEAHRTATPTQAHLLDQTFDVPARGYRLLLGLRRPRHWVTIRPRTLEATLDSLQRLAEVVVADVEPDVEGETETGSVDVEERNLMARSALARADVVVLVGEPSMKGMYALVRLISELLGFGVPVTRMLPVLNRSPRNPRVRAELATAFSDLLAATAGTVGGDLPAPTHLPERRVDEALRDGVEMPKPLPQILARGAAAVLERAGGPADQRAAARPRPVAPGSLSTFTAQERP